MYTVEGRFFFFFFLQKIIQQQYVTQQGDYKQKYVYFFKFIFIGALLKCIQHSQIIPKLVTAEITAIFLFTLY